MSALRSLLVALALAGCVDPPPPREPLELRPPGKVVVLDEVGPIELVSRWDVGETIDRVGRLQVSYRIERGAPGWAGHEVRRELHHHVAQTLLEGSGADPRAVRSATVIAAERLTEIAPGAAPIETVAHGADHGKTVELRRPGAALVDLVTMRELLTGEASVGDRWTLAPAAILAVLGRTVDGRTVSGSATATLARLLEVDGARTAELALSFDVAMTDVRSVDRALSFRQTRALSLRGTCWYDLTAGRPRRLLLEGSIELTHEPTEVRRVPLGSERLARPFAGRGELRVELAFR